MIRSLPPSLRALAAACVALALNVGVWGARPCPHHTGTHEGDGAGHPVAGTPMDHGPSDHGDSAGSRSDHHGEQQQCTCVGPCVVAGVAKAPSDDARPALATPPVLRVATIASRGVDLPPRLGRFELPLANAPPRT